MQITLKPDASVDNAPAGFMTALQTAANILDVAILNPIDVTLDVGYGEDDGSAITGSTLAEAQPAAGEYLTYASLVADLKAAGTSSLAASFVAALPAQDPSGGELFFVSPAQEKAWGILGPTSSETDGYAGFSSSVTWSTSQAGGTAAGSFDLVGAALHELTHALGRTAPKGMLTAMDLLGYSAGGVLDTNNSDARYLSFDGGKSNVVSFDSTSDPGDFSLGSPIDPFDSYLSAGQTYSWTGLDAEVMNALGFSVATASPSGFVILPGSGTIDDASGNLWSISPDLQVEVNGVADPTTKLVVQMDFVNGVIWQENNSGQWFSKASPADAWSAAFNASPLAPPVIAGAVAGQSVAAGGATIRPFSGMTITDGVANANEQVTITATDATGNPSDSNGRLSGTGLTETSPGVYQLALGVPSAVSAALQQLQFTPANPSAAAAVTTRFSIGVMDRNTSLLGGSIASNNTTTVTEQPAGQSGGLQVLDTTTEQPVVAAASAYNGPVAGMLEQYINLTPDSLNISTQTPGWFIHSGSGQDAIAVSSGSNVLDGGTGSNFLTGGSGQDTFFLDDRAASAAIWSTISNFHLGDAATLWGVTPQDFSLSWSNGQGATGYTGLTLSATSPGKPTATLTLAGFSSGDLSNGRLAYTFGTDAASGSAYMYIHEVG